MKYKKLLPITATIAITILLFVNGVGKTTAETPLNNVIVYMVPDIVEPHVGQLVNTTVVFRNALNSTDNLYNTTIRFDATSSFNISDVYGVSSNMTFYNSTDYYLDVNNTEPLFYWDVDSVNVTWANILPDTFQSFWFIANCTEEGYVGINNLNVTYYHNNERKSFIGQAFSFEISPIPSTPRLDVPIRSPQNWSWWLIGGIIIGVPLVVIIITRITLWKR